MNKSLKLILIICVTTILLFLVSIYIKQLQITSSPNHIMEEEIQADLPNPVENAEEREELISSLSEINKLPYVDARLKFDKVFLKIDKQREKLRNETIEDSLKYLSDIKMFRWPNVGYEKPMIKSIAPLTLQENKYTAEQILSNRRFQKLLQELQHLSSEDVSNLITEQFQLAYPRYQKLRKEKEQKNASLGEGENSRLGFSLENNSDGTPRISGSQREMLALLYLAGELKIHSLHDEVLDLAKSAIKDRDEQYVRLDGTWEATQNMFHWRDVTLYNRSILLKALVGTSMSESEEDEFYVKNSAIVHNYDLTHWDAEVSLFDQPGRYGVPIDYRKGKFPTSLPIGLEDEDIDKFLETGLI